MRQSKNPFKSSIYLFGVPTPCFDGLINLLRGDHGGALGMVHTTDTLATAGGAVVAG